MTDLPESSREMLVRKLKEAGCILRLSEPGGTVMPEGWMDAHLADHRREAEGGDWPEDM